MPDRPNRSLNPADYTFNEKSAEIVSRESLAEKDAEIARMRAEERCVLATAVAALEE